MGIFSSEYRFRLDGKDWCVHMGTRYKGWKYTVTLDGKKVADISQNDKSVVALLRGTKFNFVDEGRTYELRIAPVSALDYGVHVYRDGALIYRYHDRDFTILPKQEKFYGKIDKYIGLGGDDRAIWKQILEGALTGTAIGVLSALMLTVLETKGIIASVSDYKSWVIGLIIAFIIFMPARLRFIK